MHIKYKQPNQQRHTHTPHKFTSSSTTLSTHCFSHAYQLSIPWTFHAHYRPKAFWDFWFLLPELFLPWLFAWSTPFHLSSLKSTFHHLREDFFHPLMQSQTFNPIFPYPGSPMYSFNSNCQNKVFLSACLLLCTFPPLSCKFHEGKDHVYPIIPVALGSRIVPGK